MPSLPIVEVVVANVTTLSTILTTSISSALTTTTTTDLNRPTAYDANGGGIIPRSNGQFRNEAGLAVLSIVVEQLVKAAWHKIADVVDKHAGKKEEETYWEQVRVAELKAQNSNPPPTKEQTAEMNKNLGGGWIPAVEIGGTGAWVGPLHPSEGTVLRRSVDEDEVVGEGLAMDEAQPVSSKLDKDVEAQPAAISGEGPVNKDDEAQPVDATEPAQADYNSLDLWDRIQWHITNDGLRSAQAFEVVEAQWLEEDDKKMEQALHTPLYGPLGADGKPLQIRGEGKGVVGKATEVNDKEYEREQSLKQSLIEAERAAKRLLDDAELAEQALHQARVAKMEDARRKFEGERKKRFWSYDAYHGDGVEGRALF